MLVLDRVFLYCVWLRCAFEISWFSYGAGVCTVCLKHIVFVALCGLYCAVFVNCVFVICFLNIEVLIVFLFC